jgi:DNA (cytosine-5)-methyltransferase 1
MTKHKFAYKWNLSDGYPAPGIEKHGLKVFGTFICGGGSTMGYKLAGFDHLGGVEIDPQVANIYKANHNPKYLFIEDIRDFADRATLPDELYNLDILDGSPPCSSFSMVGNREKDWGKEKVFREGQAKQRLDDLFFDYIRLAKKLQPKVVIAENVKGIIQGNAKAYVKRIKDEFEKAGYKVQLFLLNAASMGVPQKRERVFFICQRNDLNFKNLELSFNEEPILFGEFGTNEIGEAIKCNYIKKLLKNPITSTGALQTHKKSLNGKIGGIGFTFVCLENQTPLTVIANKNKLIHSNLNNYISNKATCLIGSYPLDYNFKNIDPKYLIGMSVPPVMTAQIAHQIYLQWFTEQSVQKYTQ